MTDPAQPVFHVVKPALTLCLLLGVGATAGLARPQDDQPNDPHPKQAETLQKLAAVYDLDQKGQLTRGMEVAVNSTVSGVFHYHGGNGGAFLIHQWDAEQAKIAQERDAQCNPPGTGPIKPILQTRCYQPIVQTEVKPTLSLESIGKKLAALCPGTTETEKTCLNETKKLNDVLDKVLSSQIIVPR